MLDIRKIKRASLNNKSYKIEDSKKSKGKETLINKIRVFNSFVSNIMTYYGDIDLEILSDERLESYIQFLNEKNITIEKAVMEIHNSNENTEELSEEEERIKLENDQAKLDELSYKKQILENKMAQAEAERQAREDFKNMEQEDNIERISDAEAIEPERVMQPEENFRPIEPITDEVPVENVEDLANDTHIDFNKMEEAGEVTEPEVENEQITTDEPVEGEPISYEETKEEKNVTVESEPVSMVEQPDPEEQIMLDIQSDYENNVRQIKNDYTENLGKEVSNIVEKIMAEAEVYASRQVEEISKVSKQAIDIANNNTQKVLDEKAIVENDRDQYKNHYEQTLEVVKEKNEIIDSRDNEITTLKGEIEEKNNIISTKEKNIEELNTSLNERDEKIASLEDLIENYKITLATMTRELGRNFQYENLNSPQVEEEAVAKVK